MTRARFTSDYPNDWVSVKDPKFWVTGDVSASIQAAILFCAKQGGGKVKLPFGNYSASAPIIIPSNIELDLDNSIITGPGIGSATDLFQTGYVSGGVIYSNIGTANESHLVTNTKICNGTINNCGKAINVFNFIDNSVVENIKFNDCTYSIYANRSWYARFINLFSRGSASNATNAAFYFNGFVNVEQMESIFVEGRSGIGIEIAGGANGLTLFNCSVESSTTGVRVSGESGPIKFDTCYFECLTTGIDLNTGGYKHQISVDNCWFFEMTTGVRSEKTGGADLYVAESNRFTNVTTKVDCDDYQSNYGLIEIAPAVYADNTLPAVPAGNVVVGKARIDHDAIIYNSGTGLAIVKTKVHGSTLISFEHEGNAGGPKDGTVSFCAASKSAGTSFDIYVDSKIVYSRFGALLTYRFEVTDNNSTYQLYGFIFGDQAKPLDATGKLVTVSNNGGFVRVTLGTFSHPAEFYAITGTLRHI